MDQNIDQELEGGWCEEWLNGGYGVTFEVMQIFRNLLLVCMNLMPLIYATVHVLSCAFHLDNNEPVWGGGVGRGAEA